MKKLLLCATIAVAMCFASCEKFDASEILDRLDNVENQLDDLKNDEENNQGEDNPDNPGGGDSGNEDSADNNKIYYTTSDNTKLFPKTDASLYGAILISNTYKDGQGVLVFDDVVTSIGGTAFRDCTSLTGITIPDSVTSIGGEAFSGCSSLTRVDITDLSAWCKIGFSDSSANPLRNGAKLYLNGSELTDITIPSDITEIKAYAFSGCSSLTSVTIPNSVTSIEWSTFSNCTSLTSVTIPDSVTSIGGYAFSNCTSLTSITISDNCSVTSIGDNAFSGCTSLTDTYVNITALATYAISNNTYRFPGNNKHLLVDGAEITELVIPIGVTSIGGSAFSGCSSLTSATIPDSVTSIGSSAFSGCSSLTNVTIGNGVTSIGGYAFSGCSSLTSVTISDRCSVTEIESWAFSGCNITDTYVNIGDLTAYTANNNSYRFPGNNKHLLVDGAEITELVIPIGVTSIGGSAFCSCSSLTSITIPDSVTSIGGGAFQSCTSLTSVDYTGDLSAWCKIDFGDGSANPLDNKAKLYLNNTEVTELILPSGITKINNYAFRGCSSLTSVTIPDSVTSIGIYAFYGCKSLTSVYCKPIVKPAVSSSSFDTAYLKVIYVPRDSYRDYVYRGTGVLGGDIVNDLAWGHEYRSYIQSYDFE